MRHNMDEVSQVLNDAVGKQMAAVVNRMDGGPQKVNVTMSVAFNAITLMAALMMDDFNPHEGKFPNNDHCLLALLFIHEGSSISSDADARCEFSAARLWEALQDFEKFTGRNGEHLLNKNLLAMVKEKTTVDPTKFGPNSKFLQ